MAEIIKVLDYPKFDFSNEQKSSFINILLEVSTLIKLDKIVEVVKEDPDDNIIVTSAITGKAGFIISGDEHLLKLKKFKKVKILNANDFLNIKKEET